MKFEIDLIGKNLINTMRHCGYASEGRDLRAGELKFYRMLRGASYPRFHIYCILSSDEKKAILNLHLDQKQPSYKGSHAHSGEYEGPLVEAEAVRIQHISKKSAR